MAELLESTSNTMACANLIGDSANSTTAVAVTNRLAADAFDLTQHQILAPGENMAFVVFKGAAA